MKTKVYITVTIIVSLISLLSTSTPYAGNVNSDLLTAARQGDTNQVKALLDKGADVNAKDKYGDTALMGAAEAGNTDVVRVLLDKGADVNAKSKDGVTALMYAKEKNHTKIIEVLKQYGARK